SSATAASPTKQLVLQALKTSQTPMSAAEVAAAIGISRATAQRYLAAMASSGDVSVGLRYGATGRPEQEFAAIVSR
ncbi:helix-turn-helix domain-containing protein, partial [Mycobacterium kansasii]